MATVTPPAVAIKPPIGDQVVCAAWCIDDHKNDHMLKDRNCWGFSHYVGMSLESGYPRDYRPVVDNQILISELDLPRIGPIAYRPAYGREVVKLHLYRPHPNHFLDMDADVELTGREARALADALLAVADEIEAGTTR